MSTITWGKPKLEICKLSNGALPTNPIWTEIDNPVEDTTALETTEGDTTDAYGEGHELIDRKKTASTYNLSFTLFKKRSKSKPIEDTDGVITDEYAIRLTPEDSTLEGFMLPKCSVGVTDSWSSADGERWNYTFTALKPTDGGKMKQVYPASS